MMAANKWEVLERIGAYAASELPPDEAHDVERMILEDLKAKLEALRSCSGDGCREAEDGAP